MDDELSLTFMSLPLDGDLPNFDFDTFEFLDAPSSAQVQDLKGIASQKKSSAYIKKKTFEKARKSIMSGKKAPNMSRKSQHGAILYAFPSFDKCDSLVYLPTSLSRLINSADYSALLKLLLSHASKDCVVNMAYMQMAMNIERLVQVYELGGDLHPDTVTFVHSTKVVDNKIEAVLYIKFTDSTALYNGVGSQRSHDELFKSYMQQPNRAERYRSKLKSYGRSEEESAGMLSAAASDSDVVGYANWNLTLTFDDLTRKITTIGSTCEVTSLVVPERSLEQASF